ncbi:MAG: molybdate transport system substrate-binding protein [Paraglaciecola sp.]|jgi:molybdate transport system substrate-binding protein
MGSIKWLGLLLLGFTLTGHAQQKVRVAVAANFKPTLERIVHQYRQRHPQEEILVSSASTGVLYAQIKHGAPFDIFLSADSARPKLLEKQGVTLKGSRQNYALGQLVLWAPNEQLTDKNSLAGLKGKLAIANPKLAPFGQAAKVSLQRLAYWQDVEPHLVMTNNVQQVNQLIISGAAQMGFVALSQVLDTPRHQYWLLPTHYYPPITQQMVILNRGQTGSAQHIGAVSGFFDYILSAQGQGIIRKNGYQSAAEQAIPGVRPNDR